MVKVVNVSQSAPDWRWVGDLLPDPAIDWRFVTTQRPSGIDRRLGLRFGRLFAAIEARGAVASGWADQLVTQGPFNTFYTSLALKTQRRRVPHLAMSFNYTDLPAGRQRAMMGRAFRSVDRFVVFSRMERQLYADFFDLPPERFDFLHWGVAPPITAPLPRTIGERYFVALGGEARDYETLVAAARLLPHVRFVFIVRPWSLDRLSVPDNVRVFVNLPWDEAWSLVWHAEASLLPLRSAQTPNGHVTIVGGMHLGKAHVVTRSIGISDYAIDGETALLVDERSPAGFAAAVERLTDEPALAARLGAGAVDFAGRYCTEQVTADYFKAYLAQTHQRNR